ncbi:hypothetical protein EON65_30075 [archaeon]|nr:MAG: hypothetical protein EON65_30075 [archaeon]
MPKSNGQKHSNAAEASIDEEFHAILSSISNKCSQVQLPMLLTTVGEIISYVGERNYNTDEFITHALSTLRLSREFVKIMNLRDVRSFRVRGIRDTILAVYVISENIVLAFYCHVESKYYALYSSKELDNDMKPILDLIRSKISTVLPG